MSSTPSDAEEAVASEAEERTDQQDSDVSRFDRILADSALFVVGLMFAVGIAVPFRDTNPALGVLSFGITMGVVIVLIRLSHRLG